MDPTPPPSHEFALNAFCNRCGYDLRSNNVVGPCPKCGLQIAYADFNSGLRDANPRWIGRISLGVTGILMANVIFGLEIVSKLLDLVSRSRLYGYLYNWWDQLADVGFAIEWFSVLYLIAAARDEGNDEQRRVAPRKLLLMAGSVWATVYLLYHIGSQGSSFANIRWIIAVLAQLAATIALFHYMNHLAHRIGDPFLRRHIPLSMTLTLISIGFGFMVGLNSIYGTSGKGQRTQDVEYLLGLGAILYFLLVLNRFRKVLRDGLLHNKEIAGSVPK
jgi:hypothetical protein